VGEGIGVGGVIAVNSDTPFFPLDSNVRIHGHKLVCSYVINGKPAKYILDRRRIDRPYSLLHRALTPLYLRSFLTRPLYVYLMAVRTILGIRNRFERTKPLGVVEASYVIGDNYVDVGINLDGVDADGVFVANEFSGRLFTQLYIDGVKARRFEPWMEITGCREATLYSPYLRISVTLPNLGSCKMLAGREVLARRLDWAGVSYLAKPNTSLRYRVVLRNHAA